MKTASELASQAAQRLTQPECGTVAKTASERLPDKYTDRIFMRLAAIYGHKFTSMYPTEEAIAVAKAEWAEGLAGLSDFQLNQGFQRCRMLSDWNPNIPEFLRFATNLPGVELVTQRVLKKQIHDPITRRLCSLIGNYDLKHKSDKQLRDQIKEIYSEVYESALHEVIGLNKNWEPPVQIERQKKEDKPRTKEAGITAIGDAREILTGSREKQETPEYDEQELLTQTDKIETRSSVGE